LASDKKLKDDGGPVDVAAQALRHRDRSRADVAARLARAGVGEAEREAALEQLERIGWVDDARFAQSRAGALAARGRGDALIRDDLESSGVDSEAVDEAIGGLDPEAERAQAIAAERGASGATARYLDRNGFSADSVEAAIGRVAEGEGADV
jgi:regulatory protein